MACSPSQENHGLTLSDLPLHMLNNILYRLSDGWDIVTLGQVSPTLRTLSEDRRLWRKLCQYHFAEKQVRAARGRLGRSVRLLPDGSCRFLFVFRQSHELIDPKRNTAGLGSRSLGSAPGVAISLTGSGCMSAPPAPQPWLSGWRAACRCPRLLPQLRAAAGRAVPAGGGLALGSKPAETGWGVRGLVAAAGRWRMVCL